jgi:spoIIIJ-associated protein
MSRREDDGQLTMNNQSPTDFDVATDSTDPMDSPDSAENAASESALGDAQDDGEPASTGRTGGRPQRSGGVRDLEEEGEVAADYLEELLDIVDLDGDIDIDVENGRASVAIVSEPGGERSLRRLVGPQGDVLEALQELTRLAVQASTGERSRLMLDIGGYRQARRKTISEVATRACQEVQRSGEVFRMEPMTAFERKIVHDVVAAAGLESESEGVDPERRVVIRAARS